LDVVTRLGQEVLSGILPSVMVMMMVVMVSAD
jgi:hypothetical protein